METNVSLAGREIVSLADRKVVASVSDVRVDPDTMAVSHFVVNNAATKSIMALPLDSVIAVGNAFVTVQSRDCLIPGDIAAGKAVINDGFRLIGTPVYSRTGNTLGKIKDFGYDPTYGSVVSISIESGKKFTEDQFEFFSRDFVFVNDGSPSASEVRTSKKVFASQNVMSAAVQPDPVEQVSAKSTEADDDDLKKFLLSQRLTDDVMSADGLFSLAKGTVLTQDMLREAETHDALVLLTMSVEV